MGTVVSLGSINVDRVRRVSEAELTALEERYEWFPDRGETVEVSAVPAGFAGAPDGVRHGGKGANQAVAAAAAGASATMLGKVGADHGEFDVLARLRAAGVDVERVGRTGDATGTAHVFVGPAGDNRIVVSPGANDAVDRAYVRSRYGTVAAADCLLLQNEIPVEPVAALLDRLADEADRPTVLFDPAPADGAEALLGFEAVDYLTPNEQEYAALEPHLDAFGGVVVRKRGGDDVVVDGDRRFTVTPPSVEVVDTTGAGDVLNGYLAARLAAGDPLREALGLAITAGSLSTRQEGARGEVPTLATVRAFRAADDRGP
jgi:ribokinase